MAKRVKKSLKLEIYWLRIDKRELEKLTLKNLDKLLNGLAPLSRISSNNTSILETICCLNRLKEQREIKNKKIREKRRGPDELF